MRIGSLRLNLSLRKLDQSIFSRYPDTFDVYVYEDDEGYIPHFHIIEYTRHIHVCLCISENKYYSDGGKYFDMFSDENLRIINDWLSRPNDIDSSKSNWEMIRFMWIRRKEILYGYEAETKLNFLYPDDKISTIQPDYSTTEEFRNELWHERLLINNNEPFYYINLDNDPSYEERFKIGEVDFTGTDDKGTGICRVMVYSSEINSHYHIINDDHSFSCCIYRDKPYYFSHNGQCLDTLNDKQKEIMMKFINDNEDDFFDFRKTDVELNKDLKKLKRFKSDSHEVGYGDFYVHPLSKNSRLRVGTIYSSQLEKLDIYVYSNDGNVPHFHVSCDNKDVAFCIYNGKYYDHGNVLTQKLSKSEKERLNNWLDEIIPEESTIYRFTTRLSMIKHLWHLLNPGSIKQHNCYDTIDDRSLGEIYIDQIDEIRY